MGNGIIQSNLFCKPYFVTDTKSEKNGGKGILELNLSAQMKEKLTWKRKAILLIA